MRRLMTASVLFFLVHCLCGASFAQEVTVEGKIQAVVAPQDTYLITVVSQLDCPLKIEKALVLKHLDGRRRSNLYQLYNTGEKSIKSFSIAIWNSDNTGAIIPWSAKTGSEVLRPRGVLPSNEKYFDIIPLNDRLRERLKLNNGLKEIIFFMIVKIKFEDDTEYDAMPLLDSLENHLTHFEDSHDR